MMNRTQIYLPKTHIEALRKVARKNRTTVSEVIRDLVKERVGASRAAPKIPKHESLLQAAKRINALGVEGPKDLATHIDAYLYGEK